MLTRYIKDESFLISTIEHYYDLRVRQIDFLPEGDISSAYVIIDRGGEKYFLKLLVKDSAGGQARIAQLADYLPATWELFHGGHCKHISYPIKSIDGFFHVDIGIGVMVIFNFFKGENLADAYPFSRPILDQVAQAIAVVHQATAHLSSIPMRVESFDLPFAAHLLIMLEALARKGHFNHTDQQNLRAYVVPREDIILRFLAQLKEYQKSVMDFRKDMTKVQGSNMDLVLTHGDYWGGNMIVDHQHQLHIIDWESFKLAAPEADLHLYLTDDFAYFIEQYRKHLGMPVILTRDCFGFYAYKNQLSNLTNWMSRILYDNQSSEQNASDFDCIMDHCMTRWDDLAEAVSNLPTALF